MRDENRQLVDKALRNFWDGRDKQIEKQRQSGKMDAGTRGAVTGGGHLDGVAKLLADICHRAGYSQQQVSYRGSESKKAPRLPGYFRPSKSWDIVAWDKLWQPTAVIELKSQVGSFGNNSNNRAEEALGNAVDLARASGTGGRLAKAPWSGYVFVMEDGPASRKPEKAVAGGDLDPVFFGASYLDRMAILCRRMVSAGLYTAAWVVATSSPPDFTWSEPDPQYSGFEQFSDSLIKGLANSE